MNNTKLLKISDLVFDEKLYPRNTIDEKTVAAYVDALETEAVFPPIHVGLFCDKNIVVDGWHRATSRKRLGIEFIDAIIKPYTSTKELFADAVKFNIEHGLALSEYDKQLIINKLLDYNFSISEISLLVHLPKTVIVKPTNPSVTSPWGKKIYLEHKTEKLNIVKAPDTRNFEPEHIIDVKNQLKWIIALLESNDTALNNTQIKEYLKKIKDLLSKRV
jgi:hypothetical protein